MTMWKRILGAGLVAAAVWAVPVIALAQTPSEPIKPNLNWVFLLSIVTGLGFLAFIGFVVLYYVFAVVARQRKFATTAVVMAPATAPVAAPAPAPVPAAAPAPAAAAPAAAPAAPAPAPAPAAPAAPAEPAAPAPAAAAPATTGGVPRIDPNNLPDGIDAVTRGRLKKLAVLQERGQEPPADLLKELAPVLGQVTPAAAPAAAPAPAAAAPAPAAEAAPAPAAEAPPAEAPAAAPAEPAAPAAAPAPAASTGGLPRIDPNNLPDGIDAVTRGRLKKLAVFQERGQEPPADLVENLKPILDQMS
jgi:hypothetical protein